MTVVPSFVRAGAVGLTWLALALPALAADQPAPEKKPAVFKVLLPADAALEIDGYRVEATGESRRFESPPVAVGHTYSYPLKATWKGKTVTRTVKISPDREMTLDLRDAWTEAAPLPPPTIALSVPPELSLKPGQGAELPVKLKRANFSGSVTLRVEGLPGGVTSGEVSVPAGQEEARLGFRAAPTAAAGAWDVAVTASGSSQVSTQATFRLSVEASGSAEPVTPVKPPVTSPPPPITLPPAPATLAMSMPAALGLEPGETAYVQVRVQRADGGALGGEPEVTLEPPSGAGLRASLWTSSPASDRKKHAVRGFALRAEEGASEGKYQVRVTARLGDSTADGTFEVTVKRPVRPTEPTPPPPELTISGPAGLALEPGGSAYAEVRIQRRDGGELSKAPDVTLAIPEGSRLRAEPWTVSPLKGKVGYVRGYALRAVETAATGKYQVRITVRLGDSTASQTFEVAVKQPSRAVEPTPQPPELALSVSAGLTLESGGSAYAEVRVQRRDGGELTAAPEVTLAIPEGVGLGAEPWTAFPLKGKVGYVRGFALRAEATAAEGESNVEVTARLAGVTTSGTFKVRVKKAGAEGSGQ